MRNFLIATFVMLTSGTVLAQSGKASGSFATTDSTKIDFTETMIDGKMKAPEGFFLQGRQSQTMTQMVRLRSKFRNELRNSKAAVKALVR